MIPRYDATRHDVPDFGARHVNARDSKAGAVTSSSPPYQAHPLALHPLKKKKMVYNPASLHNLLSITYILTQRMLLLLKR